MSKDYTIRRAESSNDARKLRALFSEVFFPEDVGALAETMFHHLPGMERNYWFIAEESKTGLIASGFALIPWAWQIEGVQLKVAEMGIVGTLEAHRGQGLMRLLNKEFDETLDQEEFDLAVIQGIPGFYQQFGYSYAIPLENHINLPLHLIPTRDARDDLAVRLAAEQDIPFLMAEDALYRGAYSLSAFRDEAHWNYLLTESQQTEYSSEFWIMENTKSAKKAYCRVPEEGFGDGLIVSEISENISYNALRELLAFCKLRAQERQKPYIRLNQHNEATAGKMAIAMGAKPGTPYAWQIKIPDPVRLLTAIAPILEQRIQASSFKGYSGCFKLDFYKSSIELNWLDGRLKSVSAGKAQSDHSLSLPKDLFPLLCLGYRSRQELRHLRPDIIPGSEESTLLVETLFPSTKSWIHEQY